MKRTNYLWLSAMLLLLPSLLRAQCPDLGATRKIVASSFHSTVMIDYNGEVRYWGDGAAATGTAGSHVYSPRSLSGFEGTPVAVAAGSVGASAQHALYLLTTSKLYGWGYSNRTINGSVTGNVLLSEIALPPGVTAGMVSSIEGSSGGLALVTTGGSLYMRQGGSSSSYTSLIYGDSAFTSMDTAWHQVKVNSSTFLTGVIRVSYASRGVMALTSAGDVYVWGNQVLTGDATAPRNLGYARKITLPAMGTGVSVADINIVTKFTYETGTATHAAQFIRGTNNKLYSIGENYMGALGIGSSTDATSWQTVKNAAGDGDLTNVVLIGTNNTFVLNNSGDGYYAVGALTSDGYLYLWGDNSSNMIGGTAASYNLPRIPPNFTINDARVGYFEMGGHTCIAFLAGSNKFCYVGHKIRGSMGDGDTDGTGSTRSTYDCINTPPEFLCPPAPIAGCAVAAGRDLIASANHATIMINNVPEVRYWGEAASSADKGISVSKPVILYEYNGTPRSVAASTVGTTLEASGTQMWLHTSSGLWGWGYSAQTIDNTTAEAYLTKVALPSVVDTSAVNFIRSSKGGIALVTNTGEVWIKAGSTSNCSYFVYGDGSTAMDAAGSSAWHQVTISSGTPLTGVKELSFGGTCAMAITNAGAVYVWGTGTYTGSGASSNRSRAAQVTGLPSSVVPAAVEIMQAGASTAAQFILGRNGKLYAIGENKDGVLGQDNTSSSTTWITVKNAAKTDDLASIRKISSNNAYTFSGYSIGALTLGGTLYQWGANSGNMLGGTNTQYNLPRIPPSLSGTAVSNFEMGGHHTIAFSFGSNRFCFVGHKTGGAMGDSTTNSTNISTFDCGNTPASEVMCFGTVYGLSGNLLNDANGLRDTLVNGTGLSSLSSTQMYVNILDTLGYVVATTPVSAGGSYSFSNYFPGTYNVTLSSTAGTPGELPPAATLPSNWVLTGAQRGTTKGSGINPVNNGTQQPFALGTVSANNLNFGVQQLPKAQSDTFTIPTPTWTTELPLTAASGLGPLRGSDPEDMPATGSLSGKIVTITDTTGLRGNVLYYNGVRVIPGTVINNYNPNLLTIKFLGTGSTASSFTFTYTDQAAGSSPVPARYGIVWATPLPVTLLGFDARQQEANSVLVSWTTADEHNISLYTVLRSNDGNSWKEIGNQAAKGNGYYELPDKQPLNGSNYYKLKINEFSGASVFSETRQITITGAPGVVQLYPNPVTEQLSIRSNKAIATIKISDVNGKTIYEANGTIPQEINTKDWANGSYFIRILYADQSSEQYQIGKTGR